MNPERLYQQHRDDALAKQVGAKEYLTFVAMPFRDSFSFRAKDIYERVIKAAATKANTLNLAKKPFAPPKRADDVPGQALTITEEIVVQILESHFFLADLTFQNSGVLIETGIALALKPNHQIILISQGSANDLHFDIKDNNVIFYRDDASVETIAKAMIAAAEHFERDIELYVKSISTTLTTEATYLLHWFATECEKIYSHQSLHIGIASKIWPRHGNNAVILFHSAMKELLTRGLAYTDYPTEATTGNDRFDGGATALGWEFIEHMWPKLAL